MSLVEKKFVTVKRANVVLTVNQEDVERYIKKGYDVLGEDGEVAVAATPNDPDTLKKAYMEHLAEIKELKAEIARLKAEKQEVKATEVEAKTVKKPRKKTTD